MLPATMHVPVARECIAEGRHMVTASYVSEDMRMLDGKARASGVVLLNEVGLDPGIDHMTAMRTIHDVQSEGGRVCSACCAAPPPRH